MRILLIMDPGIPVPPPLYGGHERLVAMFAKQYNAMGHEVTLLAGPGSYCSGRSIAFGKNDLSRGSVQKFKELLLAWKYLKKNGDNFELIHNFGRLLYLLPVLRQPMKKIMTYGRPVSRNGIRVVTSLPNRNLIFTACSDDCVSTGSVSGKWATVYNAIDFHSYQLKSATAANAPLMFLGRLDRIKGAHTAIQIALETGNVLWIGGNLPSTDDNLKFYKENIKPFIDGKQIIYLGALNDQQKNFYLGQAKALLFPIEWNEPFGMVMVEAMACGTPVIGYRRGSVDEVIDEGKTGFKVQDRQGMIDALWQVELIDREVCRATAQKRFDVPIIAKEYLNLFNG